MAFVFKAERFNEKPGDGEVGPGAYDIRKPNQTHHGYAPFGSTSVRYPVVEEEKNPKKHKFDSSEIARLRDQIPATAVDIVNKKQLSSFASKTKRFESRKKKASTAPGPGEYSSYGFTDELGKRLFYQQQRELAKMQKKKHSNNIAKMRDDLLVVPSIPNKDRAFGYAVTKDGRFKINKPKGKPIPLDNGDSVGPGQYNIPSTFEQKAIKGVEWKRSVSMNASKVPRGKEIAKLGPGYYNPVSDFKPLYKYKQSSAFASDTPRKFFVKEKNRSLASRRTKMPEEESEDESEYVDEATPGPGYYYDPHSTSSFKVQHKEHKFQIFGSASERFPEEKDTRSEIVGPGQYFKDGKDRNLVKKTFNKNRNIPFIATTKRFDKGIIEENSIPGPGHYETDDTLANTLERKAALATDKPFCSTSNRFKSEMKTSNANPGPGAYFDAQKDEVEIIEPPTTSHYFKSSSKRDVFLKKSQLQTPHVGAYDLSYYDVYYPIKKYNKEPKELRDCKPGFNTGGVRFKPIKEEPMLEDEEGDEREVHIKKIFKQLPTFNTDKKLEPITKVKQGKKIPFNTNDKRFKSAGRQAEVPGPGEYYDKKYHDWNKPTFNLLFIDI